MTFEFLNNDLEQAKKEYSQSPPITGYNSKKADRILEAEFNRAEPQQVIESTVIREFEDTIAKYDDSISPVRTGFVGELKSLRTRLINTLRDKLTGRTSPTVPLIQMHAIMSFWYAMNNMPLRRTIADAFLKTEHSGMVKIYLEICESQSVNWNMFKLLEHMQEDHRAIFITYVLNNYQGLSMETVEKFYLNALK